MNSKNFKIVGIGLLPVFLLLLDTFNIKLLNFYFSTTLLTLQNVIAIYVMYIFVITILEDLNFLYRDENKFIEKIIYATMDTVIINCLLLSALAYKKIFLIIYVLVFLVEILQSGKIALLLNNGENVEIKFEKITKYSAYIGLILIFLIPLYYGLGSIFILPYLILKIISTFEIFINKRK